MEPILGMRYETPRQLKMALANYDVAHDYQLWYMKNDWRQVLVYYGRNVVEERCVGKRGNKHRVLPKKVRTSLFRGDEGNQASKKPVKKPVKKPIKKPINKKPDSQSREEHSFQIKSLRSKHKYCRNYNLGTLVTYKWIAMQYFKEIIEDPFMSLRKMRDDIRQKFMIDYMKALLDSNLGSTCILDVVKFDNGFVSFKRMCIYFEGVKDGWSAECRKEIRLYIMQRIVAMNKLSFSLEDTITPSIKKREWIVFPSGFQELEVKKGDQSYGVSLQHKGGGRSGRGDGNDGGGSGSGVNDGSRSAVNDGSGSGERGGGRAGGRGKKGGKSSGRGSRDLDEAPKQETSDDGPAPKQGKSPVVDKSKAKALVQDGPAPKKKRGRPQLSVHGIRIYHKNRDRSERIANIKSNKPF
nr:calcium/proton exchanger [Tanacetum cinerariifolium]